MKRITALIIVMAMGNHARSFLSFALLSVLLATGCQREDSINPVPCDVDPWAPESCTFAWDKYNSLQEVHDYFYHHDSTIITHVGDTLKFWGWVYFHGPGEPVYWPYAMDPIREAWTADAGIIYLVGNEDHHEHHGLNGLAILRWDDIFLQENKWFVEEFDSLLQKKWYVTATLQEEAEVFFPCLMYSPKFIMTALDTNINSN